jgi:putative addiction module component (TIGR02574 family)
MNKLTAADALPEKTEGAWLDLVESLPIGMKTQLVEKLLGSLHPSQTDIDALWEEEAERRVAEVESGAVNTLPGEEVFKEARRKFC